MTTGLMLFWLTLTTIYGAISHYRGKRTGIQELVGDLIDSGIVKNRQTLVDKLEAHHKACIEKYKETDDEDNK